MSSKTIAQRIVTCDYCGCKMETKGINELHRPTLRVFKPKNVFDSKDIDICNKCLREISMSDSKMYEILTKFK